jgi:hypothetical protein
MQKFSIYLIIGAILAGIIFILIPAGIGHYRQKDISPPQHMYNVRTILKKSEYVKIKKEKAHGKNSNDSSDGTHLCR